MRATCLSHDGSFTVRDFPTPTLSSAGTVLVRMSYASVCGSDVHIALGGWAIPEKFDAPGFPGHEGTGIVVESRDPRFSPGQRVLTVPLGNQGGCFAEYQLVDADFVVALADGDDLAAASLAQQYGTTICALKKFWRAGTTSAVIMGMGSAGQFFAEQLLHRGVQVFCSDVDPARIQAAQRLPVAWAGHASELAEAVVSGPGEVDLVIEAAGFDATRAQAIELVRRAGVVGCFGYPEHTEGTFPTMLAFRKSVTIEWFSNAQIEPGLDSFKQALADIRSGRVDISHMLSHRVSLEDVPQALQRAAAAGEGATKILIEIHPEDE